MFPYIAFVSFAVVMRNLEFVSDLLGERVYVNLIKSIGDYCCAHRRRTLRRARLCHGYRGCCRWIAAVRDPDSGGSSGGISMATRL